MNDDDDEPPIPLQRVKLKGSFIDPVIAALRKTETDRDEAIAQRDAALAQLGLARNLILAIRESVGLSEGDGVSLLGHVRAIMLERELDRDRTVIVHSPLTDPKPR